MNLISGPVAGRILEALGRYRFLTIAQLVTLGAGDEKTIRTRLSDLKTAKLIDRQEFRLGPSAGRLPNVHWLTPKGAQYVAEATGETIEAARPREIKASHAWHRMLTVDTLMAADAWADASGQSRPEFSSYMQRQARSAPTALPLAGKDAIADGILRLTDSAGQQRVYVLEVYCSAYSEGRSTFPVTQLEHYILAGQSDDFDNALHIPPTGKAGRVLVVCDTVELRDRLLRTLPKRDGLPPLESQTWARMHFKAAQDLGDFGIAWHKVDGGLVPLPS